MTTKKKKLEQVRKELGAVELELEAIRYLLQQAICDPLVRLDAHGKKNQMGKIKMATYRLIHLGNQLRLGKGRNYGRVFK